MSLSLYEATVPAFLQTIIPIKGLISKAEQFCNEKGVAQDALCNTSLAPDMWPFAKQVTSVCQHSAGAIAAVMSGETGPDMQPAPTTFAGLIERLDQAIAALQAITPEQIEAVAGNDVCFRIGDRSLDFTARDYLTGFAMPNFYFHAAMAYAVLRNQGADVGKRDFLGAVPTKG